jgi:hypothetical protein
MKMRKIIIYLIIPLTGVIGLFIGKYYGNIEANIRTGSPSYFALESIRDRLKIGDQKLLSDIDKLLIEIDQKNASGINGKAMVRFVYKDK